MTLIFLSAAWLAGIALAHALTLPWQILLLIGLIGAIGLVGWRGGRRLRLACGCLLALALGGGRFLLSRPHFDARSLATYNDVGTVTLEGVVATEPDVREAHVNLRVRAEQVTLPDGRELEVDGLALVRAKRYPAFDYGDRLRITGPLATPPTDRDFSYRDYLARQGIHSWMERARVRRVGSGEGSPLYAALLAFKARAQRTIGAILHEPEASLLTGILLGIESGIPADLMEAFSATGTTHIIAISGFNITIIAGIFAGLSQRLVGPRYATWVAIAGVVIYTLFVGGSAAVVRAAVMGILYLLGKHLGRTTFAPASLAAAGVAMTLLNPYTLWDVGFQLSFAATVGLILYTEPLERGATRLLARITSEHQAERVVSWLSEALLVTLAAQITTLPITLFYFRRLSLVTLLTNLLILPVQSGVMILGGIATLTGLVWLPAGQMLGWIAWLFLAYTIEMVRITARVPFASVALVRFDGWMAWGTYALLAAITWWRYQPVEQRDEWRARIGAVWQSFTARLSDQILLGGSALILLLSTLAWRSLPDGRLRVSFLDVGPGDAIFIETPSGRQVLIDGGPSPSRLLDQLGRHMGFWDHSLDLVVLSHPDDDLLPGLLPVLERYQVDRVIAPRTDCVSRVCSEWERSLALESTSVLTGEAGLRVWLDEGLLLTVLYPGPGGVSGANMNDGSLVMRIDHGEVCFLLTGDVSGEVEAELVAEGAWLDCTVLKAARHGDAGSTTAPFLAAVDPQVVVVPVAAGNRYGHPHWQVLERVESGGADRQIYRTDEDGTVEVVSDGTGVRVETVR
jgi:competence protein ComEC